MKNIVAEFIVPAVLVGALVSLAWPVASDHTMVMAQQGVLLAGFVVFALWAWRETGGDERDVLHRMLAARAAYLGGSAVLVAGIVRQSLAGAVDPWLAWALIIMVAGKVAGSVIARLRH
jgi:hypothetical protein